MVIEMIYVYVHSYIPFGILATDLNDVFILHIDATFEDYFPTNVSFCYYFVDAPSQK